MRDCVCCILLNGSAISLSVLTMCKNNCLYISTFYRYRSSRFALQAQLNRNEQNMLGDRPSGSATATDLQKRLRELKVVPEFTRNLQVASQGPGFQTHHLSMCVLIFQALQDETESLWSEYEVQCSQCSQVSERAVEQDLAELTVKWREQRAQLQRRCTQKIQIYPPTSSYSF